jgi:hypothetical protein
MASQVPYTGVPQVSPNLAPTPDMQVQTPAAAFGEASAEATKGLGRTIEQSSGEMYSRALAMQELDRQAAAVNASAKFADKAGQLQLDFHTKQGLEAKNAYPKFQQDIDDLRTQVGKELPDPYSQNIYMHESRSLQSRAVFAAGAHAGDQFKAYLNGTAQAKIDSNNRSVMVDPKDDSAFQAAIKDNAVQADNLLGTGKFSKEQRDDFLSKQNSQAVENRARALTRIDAHAAQDFLDAQIKAGNVTGDVAGRTGDYIRSHLNNVTSRVETSKLMSGDGHYFGDGIVPIDKLLGAIKNIEGSGSYNPPHPDVTHKVNGVTITEHALGAYGIMQSNLQPWLKEAGMAKMTEAEFLANPDAQDKLAGFKLGQLQDKNKSANKAALEWFTGDPNADLGRSDGGSTAAQYLQKLNKHLANNVGEETVSKVAAKRAEEISPNNPELADIMQRNAINHTYIQKKIDADARTDQLNTIFKAMEPDKDGKVPTRLEDLQDPAAHEAFNNLKDERAKKSILDHLDKNARDGGYTTTAENQAMYQKYKGALNDSFATDEERKAALTTDYQFLPLPYKQREDLMKDQKRYLAQEDKNPVLTQTIQELRPTLDRLHIGTKEDKGKDEYHRFIAKFMAVIDERQEMTKKPIQQEEMKALGAAMLRTFATPTWFGWSHKDTPEYQRKDYPQKVMDEASKMYVAKKGFAPSPDTLDQIITAAQINDFYAKQSAKAKPQ